MARGGLVLVFFVLVLLAGALPWASSDGYDEEQGLAVWSGGPVDGKGNLDGICGYGDNVGKNVPFMDLVAGFNNDTHACGRCYRIICNNVECNDQGVRVTVTDKCRAPECARGATVFELTGYAFGSMAQPGLEDSLRKIPGGLIPVRYKWEDCAYSPLPPNYNFPAFRIDPAATSEDFTLTVIYTEGIALPLSLELRNAGDKTWNTMYYVNNPGMNKWKLAGTKVVAPMSISVEERWIEGKTRKIVADDVIPVGWKPGQTYYRQTPAAA